MQHFALGGDWQQPEVIEGHQPCRWQCRWQLAYRLLSAVLQGKPEVRMELDDQNSQLVVLASSSDHGLVQEILDELASEDWPNEKADNDSFNGLWQILEVADGGVERPADPFGFGHQAAAVFHNGNVAMFRNGQLEDIGTFTISSTKPNQAKRVYP